MDIDLEPPTSSPELLPSMSLPPEANPFARRMERLVVVVVRELTDDDVLAALDSTVVVGSTSLTSLRAHHHRVAQLICQGQKREQIALLTGYSPSYVTRLQADPAFKELLAHYAAEQGAVFVDVLERMKSAGIAAIEELQERLETEPEKWSKRDLMDFAKLMVAEPAAAAGNKPTANGHGVNINVQFVNQDPSAKAIMIDQMPVPPIPSGKIERIAPENEI